MFEASAYEVHTYTYLSRLPYSCPTQPVASDTMADWRERMLQARVAACKDSYRESSSRWRSRLAQQRVRQSPNALAGWLLFGCASDERLLPSLLKTAGADWLLSGSTSDCELLRSLQRTARLLLCHLHTNVPHQLLPHNKLAYVHPTMLCIRLV